MRYLIEIGISTNLTLNNDSNIYLQNRNVVGKETINKSTTI